VHFRWQFVLSKMAKGKSKTILCKLVSAAQTGFFYVTSKNPRRLPEKLVLRKLVFSPSKY
jgi:large subunit ribosomal protein L33